MNLKYLIENDLFIVSPFLTTDRFIKYCRERGVETSREQLERFEELGLFFPVARVRYPTVKRKVKYSDDRTGYCDLGPLKEEEEWTGDVREESPGFAFTKEYAKVWLEEGHLWDPSRRSFEAWDNSRDENARRRIENFYSTFQCYRAIISWATLMFVSWPAL